MKKVKHIVVATDFSSTAHNAFHYAKRLAVTLGASITVVHITEYFMPKSESDILHISDNEVKRLADEAMEKFVFQQEKTDKWAMMNPIKTKIIKGNCIESLVKLSKSNETELIVMGTTGLQDFLSKVIGSVSLEVANKSHCPVILVPRHAVWQKIKNLMYASNFESVAPKMLQSVGDFAQAVDATIHYVHVEDFSFDDEGNVNKKILENIYLTQNPNTPIDI